MFPQAMAAASLELRGKQEPWGFVCGVFRGFFSPTFFRGRDARERRGCAAPARCPRASAGAAPPHLRRSAALSAKTPR